MKILLSTDLQSDPFNRSGIYSIRKYYKKKRISNLIKLFNFANILKKLKKLIMAKKSILEREKNRKKLVNKFFAKRQEIKKKLKLKENFFQFFENQKLLQKLPRNSSPIRLRNRCWKTGRSRGFFRFFGLSRISLRELSHECFLPGIIKASW